MPINMSNHIYGDFSDGGFSNQGPTYSDSNSNQNYYHYHTYYSKISNDYYSYEQPYILIQLMFHDCLRYQTGIIRHPINLKLTYCQKFLLFDQNKLSQFMSAGQAEQRDSLNSRQSLHGVSTIAEQVIVSSVFRLLLKEQVLYLLKKQEREKQKIIADQPVVTLDTLIEELGDQLVAIAKIQASKQIKQAQRFLSELYEHKTKALEYRFEVMMDTKIRQLHEKLQGNNKLSNSQSQTSLILRSFRSPLKRMQVGKNPTEEANKMAELKSKILNSPTIRSCHNLDVCEQWPLEEVSTQDVAIGMLTKRVKEIQENLKHEAMNTALKINGVKTQCKADLDINEIAIKELINSGFQGIWNVISNLQKRMMI